MSLLAHVDRSIAFSSAPQPSHLLCLLLLAPFDVALQRRTRLLPARSPPRCCLLPSWCQLFHSSLWQQSLPLPSLTEVLAHCPRSVHTPTSLSLPLTSCFARAVTRRAVDVPKSLAGVSYTWRRATVVVPPRHVQARVASSPSSTYWSSPSSSTIPCCSALNHHRSPSSVHPRLKTTH